MKIIKLSIVQFFALATLVFFAFNTTSCVQGEKLMTERENFTLDLPNFSIITLDFPAEILIKKGETQNIKINAQPEIFAAMTKSVSNNEWLIDLSNFNGSYEGVTIEITMPTITGLFTTSTGDITVTDKFDKVALLTLSVDGTGNIQFEGSADQIDLLIDGSGDIDLKGATDFLNARLSSTGDLHAFGLNSTVVELVSTSTGDAEIRVEEELTVTMTSTGDVKYKGYPQITSRISGTGDLKDEN